MADSQVETELVTDAILSMLGALSFPIGDAVAPDPVGDDGEYAVLYGLDDEGTDGPASDPWADVEHVYQITAVGRTRKQAEWVADKCRNLMLTGTLSITGRAVMQVAPLTSGPIDRDDDKPVPLFYRVATFRVWTTPA